MTWRELARSIEKMPQRHLDRDVRFIEPYDDGREGYVLELVFADQEITVASTDGVKVFVKASEPIFV